MGLDGHVAQVEERLIGHNLSVANTKGDQQKLKLISGK
jgi:hypothetical protein